MCNHKPVLVCVGSYDKMPQSAGVGGRSKQENFVSHSSGDWEVQVPDSVFGENHFLVHRWYLLFVTPQGRQKG